MDKQIIVINGQHYQFKIGLRGIKYLQSLSDINEDDFLIAGLINCIENNLTTIDAQLLVKQYNGPAIAHLPLLLFLSYNVQEQYSFLIGEVGIAPDIAIEMTPNEIQCATEGYLHKKEVGINLLRKMLLNIDEPIRLTELKEYALGNLVERRETFKCQ